jgi:hypothetical protein
MMDFKKAIEEAKASMLPYESWEQLPGETGKAFAAFCAYRDLGLERSIKKAVEATEKDEVKRKKRYRVWLCWSTQFRWRERAEDFDRYVENLKQGELRKTIEAQGRMHRVVTGKMLEVVNKKLDAMNPEDLAQGNLTDWVQTAIRADREAAGFVTANGKQEAKQGGLTFVSDFQGL